MRGFVARLVVHTIRNATSLIIRAILLVPLDKLLIVIHPIGTISQLVNSVVNSLTDIVSQQGENMLSM